ncbi:MAG: Glutamate-1-semialdehyde aminotransferase [uncultured Rubrobacteraceae bacterium]|uniref:Glutamate-1-semialdehyde aminotransferase n=1 Tax=uncultured Rubrobacteraceae bacterium TaxID=349277 RepID=A0A6J4QMT9_9ACTN|nr:MAG: Glutamate-1-semialdehyde aminotransferase [uncultured Rubrobacteraceae bacterium]
MDAKSTGVAASPSREEELYRSLTPTSYEYYEEGREYLPGADSRSPLFHPPYPVVLEDGQGCWLSDVDGNRLLDFTGNHTSLVLGYGHPRVLEAVRRQLEKGTAFPGITAPQVGLAGLLCERVPSFEQVRFTNSGTEATMNAVRAARAFTGRRKIAKIEGGYNGSWDDVLVSTHPSGEQSGDLLRPNAAPASLGLSPESTDNVLVLPFNEAEAAARLIEQQGKHLAAVIVEPVLGSAGMIAAEQGYLDMLREVTERLGILLIFDEVISFRVAYGGAQEHYSISPDLTCLGKLIGGGFPLGVFGGRSDIMAMFDPTRGRPRIPHPGSYNANPVSLVAGATTLELLTSEVIRLLNHKGEYLRRRIREAFEDTGLSAQVTGLGSLFAIHLTSQTVRSYRDTMSADADLRHRIFLGLFKEGVLIDPRGVGCVSAAVGEAEIERFVDSLRTVLRTLANP